MELRLKRRDFFGPTVDSDGDVDGVESAPSSAHDSPLRTQSSAVLGDEVETQSLVVTAVLKTTDKAFRRLIEIGLYFDASTSEQLLSDLRRTGSMRVKHRNYD